MEEVATRLLQDFWRGVEAGEAGACRSTKLSDQRSHFPYFFVIPTARRSTEDGLASKLNFRALCRLVGAFLGEGSEAVR